MKNSVHKILRVALMAMAILIIGAIYYVAIIMYRIDMMILLTIAIVGCMFGWMIGRVNARQARKNSHMASICKMWAQDTDQNVM